LVVDLEDDVLAEVLERGLQSEAGAVIPHLVGPALELDIMRHAAVERDRVVFGAARRLARARRITAVALLDHLGRAVEHADLAHAEHVATVPFDPELEVLVRVESICVDRELSHWRALLRWRSGRPSAAAG